MSEELDVAVVGGGVTGLYVAWRALSGGRSTAVFEASDRVGGRLLSATPDGAHELRGELGGIAVMSSHALTRGLTDRLGLERERLEGGDPNALIYLRGRRFTAAEWSDPGAVPYELAGPERGKSPEQLLERAVAEIVPEAGRLGPADWSEVRRGRRIGDRALTDVGLFDVLRERVSAEAFELMLDAGGFRPQFQNWNAAEALADLCAVWPEGSYFERLAAGYEALPEALAAAVGDGGGEIALGRRLRALEPTVAGGSPGILLTFEDGTPIVASRVVLALPHRALELIAARTPLASSAAFAADVGSVRAIPLFHVLLAYEQPWWEPLGIGGGRSATDLPIQSCFYFGTEADAGARRSLAMVGYSSERSIEHFDHYLEESRPGEARIPPAAMLEEITRQLSELHGVAVPGPYWARIADWRGDPYGGASHRWAVGARSWEVIPRMREPIPGFPLHVCGEAWSDHQGWVEGGLRSAERVVQGPLGLNAPEWLAADAYLGP